MNDRNELPLLFEKDWQNWLFVIAGGLLGFGLLSFGLIGLVINIINQL